MVYYVNKANNQNGKSGHSKKVGPYFQKYIYF